MLSQRRRCWLHAVLQLGYRWGHLVTGDWTRSETHSLKKYKLAVAGQYLFSLSQYFMLAGLRAHSIHTPVRFRCSYTMARHRTNALYTNTLQAIPSIPAWCFETKLGWCWPAVSYAGLHSAWRQKRQCNPILDWCWLSVVDGEPKLAQNWVSVSCFTACTIERTDTNWAGKGKPTCPHLFRGGDITRRV